MTTSIFMSKLSKYFSSKEDELEELELRLKYLEDHNILYNILYEIKHEMVDIGELIERLDEGKYLWKDPLFETYEKWIEEQNEFIKKPFEVEEGVIECSCGSKKVFSYSKQTRSADEPTTTFAECLVCKKKWSYSG